MVRGRLTATVSSERLQVLDEIGLLLGRETERERAVVMRHHVAERRESAIVIEAAFRVREEAWEAVAPFGGKRRD